MAGGNFKLVPFGNRARKFPRRFGMAELGIGAGDVGDGQTGAERMAQAQRGKKRFDRLRRQVVFEPGDLGRDLEFTAAQRQMYSVIFLLLVVPAFIAGAFLIDRKRLVFACR